MSNFIPNTLQYPNIYVDEVMYLLTPGENTVLLFAARQILGWDEGRESRQARISLSVFSKGYEVRGRKVANGTGMSVAAVSAALSSLVQFGILKAHPDAKASHDGLLYEINFESTSIDFVGLKKRLEERTEINRIRGSRFPPKPRKNPLPTR